MDMTDSSNQSATSSANNHWKSRCISLLNDFEKRKLSAPGPQGELLDLMKKKEKEELKLKSLKSEIQELEKKLRELDSTESSMPNISRSELQLYKLITNLTFDVDAPPNQLKGFVTGRPLKVFQLDTTSHSKQYIVDYLWKLIDPDSV